MLIFLIASIISSIVKCTDKLYDINLICLIKIEKGNAIEYYFDNFSYFFKKLWNNGIFKEYFTYISFYYKNYFEFFISFFFDDNYHKVKSRILSMLFSNILFYY